MEQPEQFSEMDEILLAYDKQKKKVSAVKGIDKKGNLQTVAPKKENNSEFLKINKHDDPLENFLSNFKRQLRNPTRFILVRTRREVVETTAKSLQNAADKQEIQQENIINKKQEKMETQTAGAEQKNYRFNPQNINWESLNQFGITKERLSEESLETMLKGGKSNELHRIFADLGKVKLQTEARLSFRETPDGSVTLAIHGVRKQPELNLPFFGYKFTEEDKKNLLETGNMGKLAETKNVQTGETNLVYISVDRFTNELVTLKAEHIQIPDDIKGIQLNKEQKQALQEGKAVWLDGMTSNKGKQFSAYLQINADRRCIGFRFDNTPKQKQNQANIPDNIGGVEISNEQKARLQEGKAIYLENMTDKNENQYSVFVKIDNSNGKPAFYPQNPDIAQKEGKTKEMTPDKKDKSQVKASNKGKKANQPFASSQEQTPKNQEKKQAPKSKGRKL